MQQTNMDERQNYAKHHMRSTGTVEICNRGDQLEVLTANKKRAPFSYDFDDSLQRHFFWSRDPKALVIVVTLKSFSHAQGLLPVTSVITIMNLLLYLEDTHYRDSLTA